MGAFRCKLCGGTAVLVHEEEFYKVWRVGGRQYFPNGELKRRPA